MENLIHKQSRAFNEVIIDKKRCIVRKKSKDTKKLLAESWWYTQMPVCLKGFLPKRIWMDSEKSELILDYCPYTTLSEIFTVPNTVNWKNVLFRLLDILDMFQNEVGAPLTLREKLLQFHIEKTKSRIDQLKSSEYWSNFLNAESFQIGCATYKNLDLDHLLKLLKKYSYLIRPSVNSI